MGGARRRRGHALRGHDLEAPRRLHALQLERALLARQSDHRRHQHLPAGSRRRAGVRRCDAGEGPSAGLLLLAARLAASRRLRDGAACVSARTARSRSRRLPRLHARARAGTARRLRSAWDDLVRLLRSAAARRGVGRADADGRDADDPARDPRQQPPLLRAREHQRRLRHAGEVRAADGPARHGLGGEPHAQRELRLQRSRCELEVDRGGGAASLRHRLEGREPAAQHRPRRAGPRAGAGAGVAARARPLDAGERRSDPRDDREPVHTAALGPRDAEAGHALPDGVRLAAGRAAHGADAGHGAIGTDPWRCGHASLRGKRARGGAARDRGAA